MQKWALDEFVYSLSTPSQSAQGQPFSSIGNLDDVASTDEKGNTQISYNIRNRTFGHVSLAKIQISLIRIFTGRILERMQKFLHADNEDSDQTAWKHRII